MFRVTIDRRFNASGGRRWRRPAVLLATAAVAVSGLVLHPADADAAQRAPARPITDAELAPHQRDVVLVGFSPRATAAERAAVRAKAKPTKARKVSPKSNVEVLTLAPGTSVAKTLDALRSQPGVTYVEPDYVVKPAVVSNDTYYTGGSLWGMYGDGTSPANQYGSAAGEAWAQGYTGSRDVAIGIIDEGIQFTHPDLAANIWTNPGEIAGNNIDDDRNGYVDDVHGWDFLNNNSTVFDGNSTEGTDTHGTHVAGTIGAVGGNGAGVAGVNWAVTMVPAKFLGPNGGFTSDAAAALDYLVSLKTTKGLNIVAASNSWGGGGFSSTLLAAINRAGDAGILFVAAAGNASSDNDASPSYPSNYECTNGGTRGWDCVIAVASITSSGALSSFSSYGATTVDIAAPGSGINSTYPTNAYASLSGTSMATPHVSGAIALCASINPTLTPAQLRAALIGSAQPTTSLSGKVVGAGRLDIGALVAACAPPTAPVSGAPTLLTATTASRSQVNLSWNDGATGETYYGIDRAPNNGGSCGAFTRIGSTYANATNFSVTGLTPSTDYCFRVVAGNNFGGGSTANSNTATARTLDLPTQYTCGAAAYAWVPMAADATTYTLTDDSAVGVTLPFSFRLYGVAYPTTQISSNGFLRFGNGFATAYTNVAIPTVGDPDGLVAPWWHDLNPAMGGTIWSRTLGSAPARKFVVTWDGIENFGIAGSAVSFQAILDEASGDITFQYLDTIGGSSTVDNGASSTIGVEDVDGLSGTQVGFNQAIVFDATALRCTQGNLAAPVITTSSLAAGTVGVAYSQTLAATNGATPYTWSISSGSLPGGLSLDAASGTISGQPSVAGTSSFTVMVTDNASFSATRSLSITVADPVTVSTGSFSTAVVGTAYSTTAAASGGTGSFTWSTTSGALPGGLTLNPTSGVISGTATAAGVFSFTLQATDSAGRMGSKQLSITVLAPPSITTASLPAATIGTNYSQTLAAAPGSGPYTWSVSAGTLPAGITLDPSSGLLSGNPTTAGTSTFTVKVTDVNLLTATRSLSIAVAAPVVVTTATLAAGSVGTAYSASLATTGGTSSYTWSVTAGALPGGLTLAPSTGRITGTPTASGTFSFTVQATDTAGRTGTKALSITINAAIPGTFNKLAPANSSSSRPRNGLVLSWAAAAGATSYEYCIDTQRNSVCNASWVSVGTNLSVTLNGLGSRVTYEWQVRAVNSSGSRLANGGTWWRFTTGTV